MEVAIYIHIPFCEKKCLYCDFNSYSGYGALLDAYVGALCQEIEAVAAAGHKKGVSYIARTLFFGGGTPTLLEPGHFEKILCTAQEHFSWHQRLETTTEANPGTIDLGYLRKLYDLGINRVSLGIQSLDDDVLRRLGRVHNARQAIEGVEACRSAGFNNLNIDLMYGLPDQSLSEWKKNLNCTISLAPEHLSLYPLTVEENTAFWKLYESGRLALPNEDEIAEMHEFAAEALESLGYEHYELSNWALKQEVAGGTSPTHRCQHNLTYWHNEPYIGLGAGAHSFIHRERYHNTLLPHNYIDLIRQGNDTVVFREFIDDRLEMAETIMLRLRLSDGISRSTFRNRFGCAIDEVIGEILWQAIQKGLIHDDGETIALTRRGRLLANEVFIPIIDQLASGDVLELAD